MADLTQGVQILISQTPAHAEVAGVVDHRFGAKGSPFFEILFDARLLVIQMQTGDGSVPQHAGAETSRSALDHSPIEDHADVLGASHVDVFGNDAFEKLAAPLRMIPDLGQSELGLQHRD